MNYEMSVEKGCEKQRGGVEWGKTGPLGVMKSWLAIEFL